MVAGDWLPVQVGTLHFNGDTVEWHGPSGHRYIADKRHLQAVAIQPHSAAKP